MKTILRWDTISLPEGQRPDALSTTWHSANYARIDLRTTPAEDAGPWEPIGIVETRVLWRRPIYSSVCPHCGK